MNNIRRKKIVSMGLIMLAMIIAMSVALNLSVTNAYAQSSGEIAYLTEDQYNITNTDTPNGVPIKLYVNKHYGRNASLSWGTEKEM